MPFIFLLTLTLSSITFANNSAFVHEALKNILSYHEENPGEYFKKIKPYFTETAFNQYQTNFEKTNLPLIQQLKLAMSGQIIDLTQNEETHFSGNISLSFQGVDVNLSQKLTTSITLSDKDSQQARITDITFQKSNEPEIKIKNYEEKVMCLKRKGLTADK